MGYEHDPRCPAHTSGYVECECNTILRSQLAEAKAECESLRASKTIAGVCGDVRETLAAGVVVIDTLRADNARLREALDRVVPPEMGQYGGPLVIMSAKYEDGSEEIIDHGDVRAARQALADTPEATQ